MRCCRDRPKPHNVRHGRPQSIFAVERKGNAGNEHTRARRVAELLRQLHMALPAISTGPTVWGVPPETPGTGMAALGYATRHLVRTGRPQGGSGALTDAIAKSSAASGGERRPARSCHSCWSKVTPCKASSCSRVSSSRDKGAVTGVGELSFQRPGWLLCSSCSRRELSIC